MNFFREDGLVKLNQVVPPFEGFDDGVALGMAKSSMFPLMVLDDRTYIMTMRWWPHEADTAETETLLRVLTGSHQLQLEGGIGVEGSEETSKLT